MTRSDKDTIRKAREGREALFPFDSARAFGEQSVGAHDVSVPTYPGLETLHLVPPLFAPLRYERMRELGREPIHTDVDTRMRMGRFLASMPVAVGALGSTALASRHSVDICRAAGAAGIVLTIGENVVSMRGYDKRIDAEHPSIKDRIRAYFDGVAARCGGIAHLEGAEGGLLVQQSVEDADAELWNQIHSDPELTPFLDAGLIGFEIKAGQGAKPGLGGEVRVDRGTAQRVRDRFAFPEDPHKTEHAHYDRHAAPGTFSERILDAQIRLVRNNFPKASVWLKLGGYRDLAQVLQVAERAGVDAVTIDGHAGGTGMAPSVALAHLGIPTLTALGIAAAHRRSGSALTMLVAGGLVDGADATKAVAAGASGIIMGRAFLAAAEADGESGVTRLLAVLREEVQLLASAVGKYHLEDLSAEDLMATRQDVGQLLALPTMFGAALVIPEVTAQNAAAGHASAADVLPDQPSA